MSATHNGTCQVCGAVQAAANATSKLAQHGYTTKWGFFHGVCQGAKALPFELSKHLVDRAISDANALIAQNIEEAKELRASSAGTATWANVYVASAAYRKGGYTWRKVEVVHGQVGARDLWVYQTTDDKGAPKFVELAHHSRPLPEVIAAGNAAYAAQLDKRTAELRIYVQWQTARLAGWSVKPLLPRIVDAPVANPTTRTKGARVHVYIGGGKPARQGVVVGSYRSVCGSEVVVRFDDDTSITVSSRRLTLVKAVA